MESPKQRKLLGPLEIFIGVIGLGVLLYVTLQNGGGNVMERTETITILDKPNNANRKARHYTRKEEDESVESMLKELADQFSKETKELRTPSKSKPLLSKDEKKYYDGIRGQATLSDKFRSAKDWYRILNASQKTYSKVRELVGEVSRLPEEKVNTTNLDNQLKNGKVKDDFYQKLSESFEIDKADIASFGQKGKQALSDWAEFVQRKSKN